VFTTDGFGIMNDAEMMELLRRVAMERGLIVLTDSDGAGFVIRNRIRGSLPTECVRHAYIPDIYGKERRKTSPGKEGKLGVEGMKPEVLLQALRQAGATFEEGEPAEVRMPITKAELMELGLSGRPDSKARRLALQKKLGLPEHLSANALLEVLNILYDKESLEELL
jgi:ribonuclease M5